MLLFHSAVLLMGITDLVIYIGAALLALLLLFFIFTVFRFVVGGAVERVLRVFPSMRIFGRHRSENTGHLLAEKFAYYRQLDDAGRIKFLRRVLHFVSEKEFTAMNGLELTEEMKVLIAASAVQLTFGLDDYLLEHFTRIFIYPDVFYSRTNKTYNKGETNVGGAIALSWKDFQSGYANSRDSLNLGLHEMAHALRFEQLSDNANSNFSIYFLRWQEVASNEFRRLKSGQPGFLRAYGGSNMSEFFSVCVEAFFESPVEFSKQAPELYMHLSALLKQDPREMTRAAAVNATMPVETFMPFGQPELISQNINGNSSYARFGLVALLLAGIIYGLAQNDQVLSLMFCGYEFAAVSYLLDILRSELQTMELYKDGIVFKTSGPQGMHKAIALPAMVSVKFVEGISSNYRSYSRPSPRMILYYIQNGRIRQTRYRFELKPDQLLELRAWLLKKNIPVLFEGFDKLRSELSPEKVKGSVVKDPGVKI